MAEELIGGAALGALFGEISRCIVDVKDKIVAFSSMLKNIQDRLNGLVPVFKKIEELNKQLDRQEESVEWIKRLNEGKLLITECSNVRRCDIWKRYRYARKLYDFDKSLDRLYNIMQAQERRDTLELTWMMRDVHRHIIGVRTMVLGGCELPAPPEFTVGLEKPIRDLKLQLLVSGVAILVISAPGGYGKTTLVKKLCQEEDIKGKYKDNIFYVSVSKKIELKVIIQRLFKAKRRQVPDFESDEDAINQLEQLLKQLQPSPILIVLDDVGFGSESIVEKFKFQMVDYKILVTSRYAFPRFDHSYHLEPLSNELSMRLFLHSAFRQDESNIAIKQRLVNQMVNICKGHPLSLSVVGKSLCGQDIVIWQRRLQEGISVFADNEVLSCLRSSIDILDSDKHGSLKECFMDMGSFPNDQKISAAALIDMCGELYKLDDVNTIANVQELCCRNLANLIITREDASVHEGYYDKYFITQHDLLRELAILLGSQKPMSQREKLYIEASANDDPICWIDNKQQPVSASLLSQEQLDARLLSVSTDEMFSLNWWSMQVPEVEVLVLNFQAAHYSLPYFIRGMSKLGVLIITKYSFFPGEISNFWLISTLSNLKSITLESVTIPSPAENTAPMKNVQKLSVVLCNINQCISKCTPPFFEIFPNLEEINIDYCSDLVELPYKFCDIIHLKRLSITNCHRLSTLPKDFGKLINLEALRLQSCTGLLGLPASTRQLHKLKFLDISDCLSISKLPEHIGDLCTLRKLYMGGCSKIEQLPLSTTELKNLEVVICNEEAVILWDHDKSSLKNLAIEVHTENANLNWLSL